LTQSDLGARNDRPPLLGVQNLSVTFWTRGSSVKAVADVSFQMEAGERLAVVGESGSGKSTLASAILGLHVGDHIDVEGAIRFRGRNILSMKERELNRIRGADIGMVFQNPSSSLNPVYTVGRQLTEGILLHGELSTKEAERRARELLSLVGIPKANRPMEAYPHELSGGMCQRVMIAAALASEPSLLVADEPTTALDVSVQSQILELLDGLTKELGLSLLIVSHDLAVVAGVADRVAVMYAGRIVEIGDTAGIYARPTHPYTEALLGSTPRVDHPRGRRLQVISGSPAHGASSADRCAFAERCKYRISRCETERPELRKSGSNQASACWVADQLHHAGAEPIAGQEDSLQIRIRSVATPSLLTVDNVSVGFDLKRGLFGRERARLQAVDQVSLLVTHGETVGIVGESGSGKSTLARAIMRLVPVEAGRILFKGQDLAELTSRDLRRARSKIQMVPQNVYSALDPLMTVARSIAEPFDIHDKLSPHTLKDHVGELMQRVGLAPRHFGDLYPHELSGGQRQRVSIARALALQPEVVIADEPTSALDASVRAQILNLLMDLQDQLDLTLVVISHDLSVVRHISSRVVVMYLGRVVETGTTDRVFGSPQHPYTQALLQAVPIPDPEIERTRKRTRIAGEVPSGVQRPDGCHFHPRCPYVFDACRTVRPELAEATRDHLAACLLVGNSSDVDRSDQWQNSDLG
jgi:peptide/nickel transport system ATP-binding protein